MQIRKGIFALTGCFAVMLCGCNTYQFSRDVADTNETETYTYTELVTTSVGTADGEPVTVEVSVSRDVDEDVEAVTKSYGLPISEGSTAERTSSAVVGVEQNVALGYPSGGYTLHNELLPGAYSAVNSATGKSVSGGSLMSEASMYAANMASAGQVISTSSDSYVLFSGQGSSTSSDKVASVISNICVRFPVASYGDISVGIASSDNGELFVAVVVSVK